MVLFFGDLKQSNPFVYAVSCDQPLSNTSIQKLRWLFRCELIDQVPIKEIFIGPRYSMVSPWSSNAVDITRNMGIQGIKRIEYFYKSDTEDFDYMLQQKYQELDENLFFIDVSPDLPVLITDLQQYNTKEGLALSKQEVEYLESLSKKYNRPLSDTEVFGFSQVNSEHCRHKIFNGQFVLNGKVQSESLFQWIKKTSKLNPNFIESAYSDNVAFLKGPLIEEFVPIKSGNVYRYKVNYKESIISLKAETHNFPTTVEPFNGAATGTGGEIRDRMAGGRGSIPLSGTAVYMTSYPRLRGNAWEKKIKARPWLYQEPVDILIKASNGASDFGNKFGQPLICGSVLSFEHSEDEKVWGFDKVVMLAGGVGYGYSEQSRKLKPNKGDLVILLGGDNYRIGMGGAAVSSLSTGSTKQTVELNAVQRSNPEIQKRVANTIRTLLENDHNPILSIHDHGAGGHLNCFTELLSETGGIIYIDSLPIGDPTLSEKEILGNESQERMGLIIRPDSLPVLEDIASRERCPYYVVGQVTLDHRLVFENRRTGKRPFDLSCDDLFGNTPVTSIKDRVTNHKFRTPKYDNSNIHSYLEDVLSIESVACKDWLTNKVDRCVGGRVAQQQTIGELQLPLSNCAVVALDFSSNKGIANSIGHAPIAGLIDADIGSRIAITESLLNLIWAPLSKGLKSVSLSANWMWPCKNTGEDARLYQAVKSATQFAISLGINIPTGKDSLSMKQTYPEGQRVLSPGTVIISASAECSDITCVVQPLLRIDGGSVYYVDFSKDDLSLGGSAFYQTLSAIGTSAPDVLDPLYLERGFNAVQSLIKKGIITAGHDISSGGLITTLLELCFPTKNIGLDLDLSGIWTKDISTLLFAENPGIILQSKEDLVSILREYQIDCKKLGTAVSGNKAVIQYNDSTYQFDVDFLRKKWFESSFELDKRQTKIHLAEKRFENLGKYPLNFIFPKDFVGELVRNKKSSGLKAVVLREQGSNSEREMAYALHLAGFEVIDVHMTDLIEGRIDFEEVNFLVAVGGFSNSDVLGSAKGWAGSFLYNINAKKALDRFFERGDTLSLGVCNGCQLFMELNLIAPDRHQKPKMLFNTSGKFECQFTAVDILESPSIMLKGLENCRLGIWAAHGEGHFYLPENPEDYSIVATYFEDTYPINPNGSDYNVAMLSSKDGRHLVMMPHLERSTFAWNWACYPQERNKRELSPWIKAFQNAHDWLLKSF